MPSDVTGVIVRDHAATVPVHIIVEDPLTTSVIVAPFEEPLPLMMGNFVVTVDPEAGTVIVAVPALGVMMNVDAPQV